MSNNNKPVGNAHFGFCDQYSGRSATNEVFVENLKDMVNQDTIFANGYLIVEKNQAVPKTLQWFKQKIRDFRIILKQLING